MSYNQTDPAKAQHPGQPLPEMVVTFEESDLATASEWMVDGLPKRITLIRFCSVLSTPGSAATIQPELGRVATWVSEGSPDHLTKQVTAAAFINDFTMLRLSLPDGKLYGRSKPDVATGASGVVETEFSYLPGWVD